MVIPRIVIAGTTSGVGKTTITAGIVAALRKRGLKVQPFKCGPDYIDPSYHASAAGVPCRNLDSWIVDEKTMVELFARAARRADVAVVEGVMGLYDGRTGAEDDGSTAEIAKAMLAPVVLVVDVAKTARSAGAIVLGYQLFDLGLNLAGVILNQVGSPSHLKWASEAVTSATGIPVLGYLPKKAAIHLPERHLGLVPTGEHGALLTTIETIRRQIESTVDIDRILTCARSAHPLSPASDSGLFPDAVQPAGVTIGVAQDEAFNFYYQDNLDLLEAWGARVEPVSPLHDVSLPEDIHGLYVGGGFPELFASRLAANTTFKQSVRSACARGMPIYGECGGLMYLCEEIVDFDGVHHDMVGLMPGRSAMQNKRVRMGYVEVEVLEDNLLAEKGRRLRGHEFHWSQLERADGSAAYQILAPTPRLEGFVRGNLLASYVHLHFGSHSALASRFVGAGAAWAKQRSTLPGES